jgi:hypothetical protein
MTSSRVTPASGRAARSVAGASPEGREVIRLAPPVVLWWVWIAFVAANAIDYALQGLPSARFGAVVSAILLLVTALMYTLALRPRVVLDGGGLTVLNPFRIHHVPWSRITSVDTAEWVRVHYESSASAGDSASGSGEGSASGGGSASAGGSASGGGSASAGDRVVHCWALYVSARAKRNIARRARSSARSGSSSRMPDEAKYLASLPVAQAMAIRLDTRARRERARKPAPSATAATAAAPAAGASAAATATATAGATTVAAADLTPPTPDVVARWTWSSIVILAVPALVLVAVALV